ncbi:MAG TPA: hypothetical protein VMM80_01460, partial [Bacteroidota bacterium]|nr:hypothetical protein [Bacteroidota bacterium]
MIVGSLEQLAGSGVQVHAGVTHPTLGPIGGWEGRVLRSFVAEGTTYLDIEMSPSTLGALGSGGRSAFYAKKMVFTRFRVKATDAEALTAAVQPQAELMESRAQHEWFNEVGSKETDPTKFVADRAAGGTGGVDLGRRQALRLMMGVAGSMMLLA